MKKKIAMMTGWLVLSLFLCINAAAQEATDYFAGAWKVEIIGTPSGDGKMILNLDRIGGKLQGGIIDTTTYKQVVPFTSVEEKENAVSAYFSAEGYDVYITLVKKDDDHVTGNLLDMFDVTGVRVKLPKPE
jgi:hypothetical protein